VSSNKKSQLYLPNNFCRSFLEALDHLAGKNGVSTVLNLASLKKWVDAYPPDDRDKQIDFAEFAGINQSLEDLFGVKGGRSLSRQAGWAIFDHSLMTFPEMEEAIEGAHAAHATEERFHLAINALSDVLNEVSDITSTTEITQNESLISITTCPVCWGRSATSPTCSTLLGIIERNLVVLADGTDYRILEDECIAVGDSGCVFIIRQNDQK
jgi:hypothetical protein